MNPITSGPAAPDHPAPDRLTRRRFLAGASALAIGGLGASALPGALAIGTTTTDDWLRISVLQPRIGDRFAATTADGTRATLTLTAVEPLAVVLPGANPDRQLSLRLTTDGASHLPDGLVTLEAHGLAATTVHTIGRGDGIHQIIIHGDDRP